jgi:primosomal replication protein N
VTAPPANRLTLDGVVRSREALRYTPAGIPVLELTLAHASTQTEAGSERRVECEIAAVAFAEVAQRLDGVAEGARVVCEGFLARRYRTGISVALHVATFEPVN